MPTRNIALDTVITADEVPGFLTKLREAYGVEAVVEDEHGGDSWPVLWLTGTIDALNKARLEEWGDGVGGAACAPCPIGECCSWWDECNAVTAPFGIGTPGYRCRLAPGHSGPHRDQTHEWTDSHQGTPRTGTSAIPGNP